MMTTTPEAQIRVHTLLAFRCPSTLSEQLAACAARRGSKNISGAIRDLLEQALKTAAV
jgi:hypothetical protein